MIRLTFGREPDLNGDYVVGPNGYAVLPLLGRREVGGIPAGRLREALGSAYAEQLRNQDVQVILLRRVRVLGAVQKPGMYHVDETMQIGDVVALAGGVTTDGRDDAIRIVRDGREIESDLVTSDSLLAGLRSGDQVMVPEKSWFTRNSRWILGSTLSLGVITLVRVLTN